MINSFRNEYAYLSNFYYSPFVFNDITYKTVEHFFQASKTVIEEERQLVIDTDTPKEAKAMGRIVTLRPDWERIKDGIMLTGVMGKFAQNDNLMDKLLSTAGEELVEGNYWHDTYWGVCYCKKCNGKGRNQLGKTLMSIRDFILGCKE